MAARTIRTNLLWVVFAASLPLMAVALWQAYLALEDSRDLVASRLRANAWAISESERDPFIIAQHSLSFAVDQPDVRNIGSRCSAILAGALPGAYGLVNFVRTDAQGKAQCSVLPFTKGQDLSNDRWWTARQGRTALYLAEPEIGTIARVPVLIMVLPLFSPTGEFQGTLSAGINIRQLKASLESKKSELRGVILIAQSNGQPIITSDAHRFGPLNELVGARAAPHDAIAKDGSKWTYVTAPLYRDELHIVYAEPKRQVTQAALARIWPSLLLPLLALLLSSVAIWFAAHHLILRWLAELQRLTARFARGDFSSELDKYASAPVELAGFAADLHDMAAAIEAQERELREALAAKTALTREVNHRVKNNLQIVNSLLTLQSEKVADPGAKVALAQAKSRIAALGLIHRLLYEGEGSDQQGSVNMRRLLNELCAQLRSTYRERADIALECDAADIPLVADQAVPVTLFTVEAITNAFQHGFAGRTRGRIMVTLAVDGAQAEMRVADDGQGFSQELATSNMGIDLIRAFAEQIGGSVEIVSTAAGTTLTLRFGIDA